MLFDYASLSGTKKKDKRNCICDSYDSERKKLKIHQAGTNVHHQRP